jgi:RimJ/RimL family protein N-acetyltransferase
VEGSHRAAVALWMVKRIPEVVELPGGYEAVGIARDGKLIGGLLYTNYVPCEGGGTVQMWAAGDPGWLSRRVIAMMLGYPFVQLGCHRITLTINAKNRISREISERLGFRYEGVMRQGIAIGEDMTIYGMLREECPWEFTPQ